MELSPGWAEVQGMACPSRPHEATQRRRPHLHAAHPRPLTSCLFGWRAGEAASRQASSPCVSLTRPRAGTRPKPSASGLWPTEPHLNFPRSRSKETSSGLPCFLPAFPGLWRSLCRPGQGVRFNPGEGRVPALRPSSFCPRLQSLSLLFFPPSFLSI